MTEKNMPAFVLCFAADSQGCGWHRIQVPLASLVEAGVADGRIDMALWPDHAVAACAPDAIVFQRQVEDGQIEAMKRWRSMLPNTLFVYELDDYLGGIPAASFHAGFMPPNIEEKVARGLEVCDRVTTTTEAMAEWLRSLGAKDVRVIPNMLPASRLHEREPRMTGKLRIGFAGGLSHGGDLELIRPAMEEIGDEVEWVFFGTKPDIDSVRIEYHPGVATTAYMDVMAKLDVDLYLAPLEDNRFNQCKSNLRLVEAAAVGACVIAQDMEPYRIDNPPVFAHASTPEEWTAAIRHFIRSKPAERRRSADAMRAWTGRHYVLERSLSKRMDAWLPKGEHWKPKAAHRREGVIVSATTDSGDLTSRMKFLRRSPVVTGLEAACAAAIEKGADVLWLRPTTTLYEKTWNGMVAALKQAPNIAAVVPLATDGPNAFPEPDKWMPMSDETVVHMEKILGRVMRQRRFSLATVSGPVVLIANTALNMLGAPDVGGCNGNEEQAVMEWGLRAARRDWKHMQVADGFASSLAPPAQADQVAFMRLQARGLADELRKPSESPTALERETIELELLGVQWGCPRPGSMGFDTDYAAWKALTDARRRPTVLDRSLIEGGRVPVVTIADFGNPGSAVPFGWIIHVDDTVALDPDALDEFAHAIAVAPLGTRVVYADHDTRLPTGGVSPEFKPDFDLELFLAQDYVTPICAVRVNMPLASRGDLFAHVLDIALEDGAKAFRHIPRTLGSASMPTKPEEMALDAVQRMIIVQQKLGEDAVVEAHKKVLGCLSVVRDWRGACEGVAPLVTIVIPTLGGGRLIQPCINTIRQHTAYPNYEILVVQNGERQEPELGSAADDPRVRVVRWSGAFNWSVINNWAIRFHVKSEYIVTMNDDVCSGNRKWLDAMMGHAVLKDVGAVGISLVHPMGIVQHVGVVCHNGIAGHMHKGLPLGQPGHLGRAMLTHEASAVTGACMLFRRNYFDMVDGFDEMMPRNYNDTDFCMKLRNKGLRNVVEMSAELMHPEGSSRPDQMSPDSLKQLADENRAFAEKYPGPDPYWNPNLALGLVHGGVMIRGLNAEVLNWTDAVPTEGQHRVLLVNDLPGVKGLALDIIGHGGVPMAADLSGFRMRMTAPSSRNAAPWDVRDPERMAEGLKRLGVSRIVLRSLVGAEGAAAPVEALRCFAALGIEVSIEESEPGLVDPTEDTDTRVFGGADTAAWRDACRKLRGVPEGSMSIPILEGAIGVRVYKGERLIADSSQAAE